jgi:hypothetical protein
MGDAPKRDLPAIISGGLLVVLVAVYLGSPDALAAITIWPFWVPASLPALILVLFRLKSRWRLRLTLLLLWLVAWAVFGDEPMAIARGLIGAPSGTTRVVSLNCAGTKEAVLEVIDLNPDIVLIQESVGRDALEKLRAKLGADWTMVVGIDASILARGELKPVGEPPYPPNHTSAWLGDTLIVSHRLAPPVFRMDYWNPACWTAYAENKRRRRAEFAKLVEVVSRTAADAPLIIGGDFNTPPDHTITEPLSKFASDAFAGAGRGWGATGINWVPMVRIDQIWASQNYSPVNAFARKTKHSDHRMAVADFNDN